MKLKLIVNGCEAPDDYKLLRTTINTVASLRKTAILRFNSERLTIISTPKSSLNSSNNGTILRGDTGQLWCTIPHDVFRLYTVISARELNTITMECNCDSLLSVFKRYDRVMNQGSSSNMTIKLQSMPEWNTNNGTLSGGTAGGVDTTSKPNPICALGITFEEIVHTSGPNDAIVMNGGVDEHNGLPTTVGTGNLLASNKVIMHSFKVPVKLLFRAQDTRIQEPMINYIQLMMYKLPPISGEFGSAFHGFIRRVERYSNVNHIHLMGVKKKEHGNEGDDVELKIIVNELDWHLEICWNGPLDSVIQRQEGLTDNPSQNQHIDTDGRQEEGSLPIIEADKPMSSLYTNTRDREMEENIRYDEDLLRIEDSSIADTRGNIYTADTSGDTEFNDISVMVEKAEQESSSTHEVIIRCKDWKVCSKLYAAFEEVVLAISHDESCVFHCSLDRGSLEDSEDVEKPRERGQIIYYIARSKGL
ncbi:mitosis entry checkpoint [Saccharomyces cerevisiae]|uniref:DNA damage checkpoint control protein MEC3 n=3 Tax=Saccharomyces cerevisiae TaxID=4932 RepID=MEC3_YEAST|nr:Mec3p [Saccharomyces cerevisiae S288C]Q02574.3 RecName: Full=DNA damage checkpoint control protein MEC3 [Saccharomyces cerevisiae S288C]7ST9_H Chain H, DNA damage checkpoint control protein MEC3 [Saccharomyces cerevisiae S288C]7STB_H Chain H, DNA damage checkpoint control protein MEC3 [Saccharomyces cerevisiae S288C]8DQW_H Chain H, DNA damage checkpoint control protein MEC3 [Saccharomyces cerevisiae]8FS3_F Chain F, DNA damage checkpoint control protein MEC3 [Saccharomyces cerevisiae]8FS4_F|eukprot:NP_013391.1 Mec3p [Saccharomyces cerevisiae S288C]